MYALITWLPHVPEFYFLIGGTQSVNRSFLVTSIVSFSPDFSFLFYLYAFFIHASVFKT